MANIQRIREARADLERVRAAIVQVEENGQSVSVDGASYDRANLNTLYTREKSLMNRLGRLQRTRPMASGVNFAGGGYS